MMGNQMQIDVVRWAESPVGFYVDRTWTGGSWALGPRPICLAPYHADLLRHVLTPGPGGRLPYDVIGWAEPAKSGKSTLAGLIAQYMALHGDRNSQVVLASNKRDQAASLMYASFADSVRMNPALGIEPGRFETAMPNGSTVRAIPSNASGEAGARFSCVIFDELWGYQHTDAIRLWSEFKIDPTRTQSVKVAVGYGGYVGESDLWLGLLESGYKGRPVASLAHIRNGADPACWANGRTFVFWSHECRQPWQSEDWREQQRRTLRPAEYARMIEVRFAEGEGNFCSPEAWDACVDPAHRPLLPGKDRQIFVGLDLALAPGGDDCAAVAVYSEGGKVYLAFHEVWRGVDRREQLKLTETVKPWILRVAEAYDLGGVWFDPWQSVQLAEELQASGIRCEPVYQTHGSRGPHDTTLYELVVNRRLVLYDMPEIRGMARFANAKELGDGRIFITKAARGKIDALIALSNCASPALDGGGMWLIY
jgi:hypothetical protein